MRLRKRLAIWFYALFIQAGYLKSDPRLSWVPFDLTILMALVVAGFLLLELFRSRRMNPRMIYVLLFFISFLPAVVLFDINPHQYAHMKTLRFFSQTVLVAVGPFFFLRSREELQEFFKAIVFLGMLSVADVALQFLLRRGAVWNITAFGSSVIAMGRSVGFVSVLLGVTFLTVRRWFLNAALLLGSTLVLIISGQRMGIVGPPLAVLTSTLAVYGIRLTHMLRLAGIGLLIVVLISATYFSLPMRTRSRIEVFFHWGISGFLSTGNDGRVIALVDSLDASTSHPAGLGLGGFHNQVGLWQYPHNIVAEVFVEGGWLAGAAFVLSLGGSCALIYPVARVDHVYLQLLGLLLFAFFYALVAGDINDNRMLFALISCALGIKKKELKGVAATVEIDG